MCRVLLRIQGSDVAPKHSGVDLHNGLVSEWGSGSWPGKAEGNALTCENNHGAFGGSQRDRQMLEKEAGLLERRSRRVGARCSEGLNLDCVRTSAGERYGEEGVEKVGTVLARRRLNSEGPLRRLEAHVEKDVL